MKFFIKLFLIFFSGFICSEESVKGFYSQERIDFVFKWVAKEMSIQVNPEKKHPLVMPSEDVDDDIYNAHCSYCDGKRINWYVPSRNEIWILRGKDEGVLAHELVHYFQVFYFGEKDDPSGVLEDEAIKIQELYRSKVLFLL